MGVALLARMQVSTLQGLPLCSVCARVHSPTFFAQAMVEQMARDHELLRTRIQRLGGRAGLARLDAALARARANAPATPPSPPRTPGQARASPAQPDSELPGPHPGLVRRCLLDLLLQLSCVQPREHHRAFFCLSSPSTPRQAVPGAD